MFLAIFKCLDVDKILVFCSFLTLFIQLKIFNVLCSRNAADSESSTVTASSISTTPTLTLISGGGGFSSNVFHEEDCYCPYCYIRSNNKKNLQFSVNAANMIKIPINSKHGFQDMW